MGWRYRRSVTIAPGARLNITKSGINSVSFGGRGASLNMGQNGTQGTIGLPGSGLSYSRRTSSDSSLLPGIAIAGLFILVIAAIKGNRLARLALVVLTMGLLEHFQADWNPQGGFRNGCHL